MKISELDVGTGKNFNIFFLVVVSSVVFFLVNIFFYQFKDNINYFELSANLILLTTTFYLIYITQKHSTNKSEFHYYTSIGFSFLFFGLFILTLDYVYIYPKNITSMAVKVLFVFGYSLLAIGVTKWIKYNESRQDELTIQANTDELTGILNRRSFTNFVNFEFNNNKKNGVVFSLLIIDIDYFKMVNDEHGHLAGDEALKELAKTMINFFRSVDKVCRWGGEEFAILLPNTNLENSLNVAEKLRLKIENHNLEYKMKKIHYTVSIGVAEIISSDANVDNIINRADKALYMAKNNNRNCVRCV